MSLTRSIREAAGDLVMVGCQGTLPSDPEIEIVRDLIARGRVAGVLLFRYNITGPEQLAELCASLRDAATELAPLIAVDQEGGKVQRLGSRNGFRDHPSAKQLAETVSVEEAKAVYRDLGAMLSSAGITINFAPCVDLHTVGNLQPCPAIGAYERGYSSDPAVVTKYAGAFIEGLREQGILSCLKHFPGHGSSQGDTHQDLFDISASWDEAELAPYRELVATTGVDAIMTTHLINRRFGDDKPATFSPGWHRKLRDEIKFDGVIVTDDLHMGAIQKNFGVVEAAVAAIGAGSDLLLLSNNKLAAGGAENFIASTTIGESIADTLVAAVDAGTIPAHRVHEAAERVRNLRRSI